MFIVHITCYNGKEICVFTRLYLSVTSYSNNKLLINPPKSVNNQDPFSQYKLYHLAPFPASELQGIFKNFIYNQWITSSKSLQHSPKQN